MAEWWPEAKREQGSSGGRFNGGSPKGVLHTTEGGSYAGALSAYRTKSCWPHATLTFENGRVECYQHLPLDVAGKALKHPRGTGETNRNNVIQCEIVGSADPNWARQHGLLYVKDFPQEYLVGISAWMRFVEEQRGVQRAAPFAFPGGRLDWSTWNAASGWLGHCHVPHNDHVDPGQINIGYLLGPISGPQPLVVGGANRLQGGYALVGPDGGVFCSDAPFLQSLPGVGIKPNKPVVGMAWTRSGNGYWLTAADGGVFCFGDAQFLGAMSGRRLSAPIVDIASDPHADGYWLVGSDGGVFAFGSATFHGSLTNIALNKPVVGIAPASDSSGYWLVGADGGVFAMGVPSYGGGDVHLNAPVTAMCATPSGRGYWLLGEDGGVFGLGDAGFFGNYLDLPDSARQGGPRSFAALVRNKTGGYTIVSSANEHYAFAPTRARFPNGTALRTGENGGGGFTELRGDDDKSLGEGDAGRGHCSASLGG